MKIRDKKLLEKSKEELVLIINDKETEINRLNVCISEKIEEMVLLAETNKMLSQKLQHKNKEQKKSSGYNKGWTWVGKIIFALRENDRPMLSTEIISCLEQFDPNVTSHWSEKTKSLSAHLAKATVYGRIKQYKVKGILGYFYILPEWTDGSGLLKPEYKKKEPIV